MSRYPRAETPGARGLAWTLLRRVEREGAFASILLEHHTPRLSDPRDAPLARELVLGVLRQRARLDHALARICRRKADQVDPALWMLLRVGAYEILELDRVPEFATVHEAVELAKRVGAGAAGFVNGVLRGLAREGRALLPPEPSEGDLEGLACFASHPLWWVERQVARRGWAETRELLALDNQPAPVILCANLSRIDGCGLARELAGEGIATEPCGHAPAGLRVVSGAATRSRALARGLCWVQDEASQLVPALFGASVGPRVADVCAAPGAKTFQLATALAPAGLVVAADRHIGRLGRLVREAQRLGLAQEIAAVAADMTRRPAAVAGTFDQVLVDAPCSGTGTLRRRPEIRWRLAAGDLEGLARRQGRLLEAAAALVAPAGALVYSVCSLEPEEGAEVVLAFLARHPEWTIAEPRARLSSAIVRAEGFLATSPLVGMDGFFGALLVRRATAR